MTTGSYEKPNPFDYLQTGELAKLVVTTETQIAAAQDLLERAQQELGRRAVAKQTELVSTNAIISVDVSATHEEHRLMPRLPEQSGRQIAETALRNGNIARHNGNLMMETAPIATPSMLRPTTLNQSLPATVNRDSNKEALAVTQATSPAEQSTDSDVTAIFLETLRKTHRIIIDGTPYPIKGMAASTTAPDNSPLAILSALLKQPEGEYAEAYHFPFKTNLSTKIVDLAERLKDKQGDSIIDIAKLGVHRNGYRLRFGLNKSVLGQLLTINSTTSTAPRKEPAITKTPVFPAQAWPAKTSRPVADKPLRSHAERLAGLPEIPEIIGVPKPERTEQRIPSVQAIDGKPSTLRRGLIDIRNLAAINEYRRPRDETEIHEITYAPRGNEFILDGKSYVLPNKQLEVFNHLLKNITSELDALGFWQSGYGADNGFDDTLTPSRKKLDEIESIISPVIRALNHRIPGFIAINNKNFNTICISDNFRFVIKSPER
jgi:hypothetical protein